MKNLTFSLFSPLFPAALALAAALVFSAARASADEPDAGSDDTAEEPPEPDELAAFYDRVGLPPYLERRVQAILHSESQEARAAAVKVGLRRLSRARYRRTLVSLHRSADTRIRALIGGKKFLAWNRARLEAIDEMRETKAPARQCSPCRPAPSRKDRALQTRARCAELWQLLRGAALANATVEEGHFWIHEYARRCRRTW